MNTIYRATNRSLGRLARLDYRGLQINAACRRVAKIVLNRFFVMGNIKKLPQIGLIVVDNTKK